MKNLFKLLVVSVILSLIFAACTTPTKILKFEINDQEAAVGKDLVINLISFVTNASPGSMTFTLESGDGSITGSTYTYSSDIADVGEHQVTIKVIDSASKEAECTFIIDTQITIAGNLSFLGSTVSAYNSTSPNVKIHVNDILYEDYTFKYSASTGEYQVRGLPQEQIKIWLDFNPPEPYAETVVPQKLPGGMAYTGSINLSTTPISEYTDFNLGTYNAHYMMHVTEPYDNSVVNSSASDPYPVYYSQSITFTWDTVLNADHYYIYFYKPDGSHFVSNTGTRTTYTNDYAHPLPPLEDPEEFYRVEIQARDESNVIVGSINTVFSNGYDTSYKFRVEEE